MKQSIKVNKQNIIVLLIASLLITTLQFMPLSSYLINFILPLLILLTTHSILLKNHPPTKAKAYYFLIPILLIFLCTIFIPMAPSNQVLNIIIIPILISIYFFTLTNKYYHLNLSTISWIWKLFPAKLFQNLEYLTATDISPKKETTKNILLGIIIGGGIGLILLSLLVSADAYFDAFITSITNLFPSNPTSIIRFLVAFLILFSTYINILQNKTTQPKNSSPKALDEVLIITILSIINLVFLLFLISELSKVTTNFLQLPIEYTYSSYAREGFFQLLFVTIINFAIITYLLYKTNTIQNSTKVKKLILLLIMFSCTLIFNSYYRMYLYIKFYDFTILRLQVILFLTMELILFLLITRKLQKPFQHRDSNIYFIVIITFYIINLYTCNSSFIHYINNIIS